MMSHQWEALSPQAVAVLVHGLGAHCGRWEFLADFLVKRNISCYAIELEGFGETKGLKGHIDTFDSYFADIKALYAIAKNGHPGKKIFLVGESLGGLLAFLMAAQDQAPFDGLICISPAFKSRLKFSLLQYVQVFLASIYNPRKQFTVPFDPAMCTRDRDYQKIMEEDKREHQLATSRFLMNILLAQISSQRLKGRLKIPTLFLIAGCDVIVDSGTSLKIYESLKVKDKKFIQYPEMSHALSIDLGREKVFKDIAQWINGRAITGE